jgi:hypothetical protein
MRIKNVFNYRKPRFWVILSALVLVALALVSIGLLTNPKKQDPIPDEEASAIYVESVQYEWEYMPARSIFYPALPISFDMAYDIVIVNVSSGSLYLNDDLQTPNYINCGKKMVYYKNQVVLWSPIEEEALDSDFIADECELKFDIALEDGQIKSGIISVEQIPMQQEESGVWKYSISLGNNDSDFKFSYYTENGGGCLIERRITAAEVKRVIEDNKIIDDDTYPLPGFSEEEVAAARAVVEEYYRAIQAKDDEAIDDTVTPRHYNATFYGDETQTLLSIDYNEDDSFRKSYIEYGGGSINGTKIEDVIVFKVSFNIKYPEGSFGPFDDGDYTNWSMILIRDGKESPWLIDDQGY